MDEGCNGKEVSSVHRTALQSKVLTIPLWVFESKTLKVLTLCTHRKIAADNLCGNFSVCWDKEILIYIKGKTP
ncbi:MAG: hypothetical protein AB7E42_04465 [Anaerotignaceae bacterium]